MSLESYETAIWLVTWHEEFVTRHSFVLYFIFSLVFFPLALLTAYLVRDRRAPAY